MCERVDHERMNYVCTKIMENEKILQSNGRLWTLFLDNKLKEFVILYNFNFFEVANRFHQFISINKKYEFNEDEMRRHWAFIHAARYLNITIDEDYYDDMRQKYKVQEEVKKKKIDPEEVKKKELEEKVKNQKEIEKLKYERFNLITINPDEQNVKEERSKEIDTQIPEEKGNTNEEEEEIVDTKLPLNEINVESDKKVIQIEKDTTTEFITEPAHQDDEVIDNLFQKSKYSSNPTNNIFTEDNTKEKEEDYIEEDLFPIKTSHNYYNFNNDTNKEEDEDDNKNASEKEKNGNLENSHEEEQRFYGNSRRLDYANYNYNGLHEDLEKTKNMDQFIREDNKLREQYENLNVYYNFAVKSLNYFIPKLGQGLQSEENANLNAENIIDTIDANVTDPFEMNVIKKTSLKINELFTNSMKEASEKISRMSEEELKKKIEDEEKSMNTGESDGKIFKNLSEQPNDEDQEQKLIKFKEHLFCEAKKVTTPELLSQIVNIINSTYIDEVKMRNEDDDKEEDNPGEINAVNTINTTTANETTIITDKEKMNRTITDSNQQTQNNLFPNQEGKYKYYYRGIAYYSDMPPKNDNNKDSDDSYVDDD